MLTLNSATLPKVNKHQSGSNTNRLAKSSLSTSSLSLSFSKTFFGKLCQSSFIRERAPIACALLLSVVGTAAESVTLAWDRAASHTNLSAFILKYGTSSGSYSMSQTVSTNLTTATVNNLTPGVRYFFAVTARNVANLESDPSNEISFTPPIPASDGPTEAKIIGEH